MAAEGVFGEKVRFDTRYNWGVNMKGEHMLCKVQ